MHNRTNRSQAAVSERIESIDILRGLTILCMLFVNDVAGVTGTPAWMKHISPPDADGMTFVDVVFPAFLFIVGMSIPFAIERRLKSGSTYLSVWKHIIIRTASLLIIGVFMVNCGSASDAGILPRHLWILLMYIGVILVWNSWPKSPVEKRKLYLGLRLLGVLVLFIAAVLFRGPGEAGFIELRPKWWGILGLIGWAYLVSCVVYLSLRKNLAGMVGTMALLYCIYMADKAGAFTAVNSVLPWINIGSMLGSQAAITLSGIILGVMLQNNVGEKQQGIRLKGVFLYGLALTAAGLLLHSLNDVHTIFIINKIYATPPWCLLCSAITVGVWIIIYWLVDMRGWKRWTTLVAPAGRNALFVYILAPIFYSIFALLAEVLSGFNFYEALGSNFAIGFWRSLLFALGLTWLSGRLRSLGIWLRL